MISNEICMKNLFSILLILPACILFSCKKDQSSISGNVTYKDSLGNSHVASDITLNLHFENSSGDLEKTTSTDNSGAYAFTNVADGQHYIKIESTINGHDYYYVSDVIYTEKDDPVQISPVLEW